MKKICSIFVMMIGLMVVLYGIVQADDYTPLPGVLSPDQVDFSGKTVTILGLKSDPVDWSEDMIARVKKAEELFNCKIEGIMPVTSELVMNRIMSGDSARDIITRPHREISYFKLVSQSMLYPVGELLPEEYYQSLSNVDRNIAKKLKQKGEYYSFGNKQGPVNGTMMFAGYNKSLLEREGQPDPYELFLKGEWTYEAWEKIAQAVTRDTDGDGEIDQWGMSPMTHYYSVIRFAPSNGVELAAVNEAGEYVFSFNSQAAIEVLNTIKRWTDLNIMAPSGGIDSGNIAFQDNSWLGGYRFCKELDDEWGIVPQPMGPSADSYNFPAFGFQVTVIPANAENPEGLIALYEYLYRPDDARFDEWMDWLLELAVDRKEQWDMFLYGMEHWEGEGDPFQNSGFWKILQPAIQEVLEGKKGAAAAMREIEPEAQAYLNDLFKQK